jgi:hypothetical protein
MKKVILVLIVASLAACLRKPAVETVAVEDTAVVVLDSLGAVDSLKAK